MGGNRLIVLGVVAKPFGLKGELKVASSGPWLEKIGALREAVMEKNGLRTVLKVESVRVSERAAFMKFSGIDSIEQAEGLRGAELVAEEEALASLPGEEPAALELPGMEVVFENGERVGTVTDVHDFPTCDGIAVRTDGGGEILIPMIKPVLRSIDREKRVITVEKGLLEELL